MSRTVTFLFFPQSTRNSTWTSTRAISTAGFQSWGKTVSISVSPSINESVACLRRALFKFQFCIAVCQDRHSPALHLHSWYAVYLFGFSHYWCYKGPSLSLFLCWFGKLASCLTNTWIILEIVCCKQVSAIVVFPVSYFCLKLYCMIWQFRPGLEHELHDRRFQIVLRFYEFSGLYGNEAKDFLLHLRPLLRVAFSGDWKIWE